MDDEVDESIDISVPYCGPLKTLPAVVRRLAPDLVVVAVPTGRPEVFEQLLGVADAGFQIVGLPEIYEYAFGRVPVEDLTSAWFMSVLHAYNRPANRLAKRAFDIVVAIDRARRDRAALPADRAARQATPRAADLPAAAPGRERPAVRRSSSSARCATDAEAQRQAQWAATNDPAGHPGRPAPAPPRLDELPQLWNVLRGEMSIVGPRPERPEFLEHLQAGGAVLARRHLVKPGITGWAQIRAATRRTPGTAEKLSYDLWYLRHRSLVLDVMICLKTFPRMAMLRGSR